MSHIDCPGGGQVWVEGTTLFVGHMRQPNGTSIYDVEDPKKPRLLAQIEGERGIAPIGNFEAPLHDSRH